MTLVWSGAQVRDRPERFEPWRTVHEAIEGVARDLGEVSGPGGSTARHNEVISPIGVALARVRETEASIGRCLPACLRQFLPTVFRFHEVRS
ncbi:hypothetical protein [Streptomyces pratensis]|uniref:hypothetical protein n=1 Tax=Streptomyces pratensis TaxID=1169025 RepID=UPI00363BF2FD